MTAWRFAPTVPLLCCGSQGIGFGLGFSVMVDPIRAQMIASRGEYNWVSALK